MDGQKAGEYVRFRSDELGDIGRVQRQQRFLKAMSNNFLQVSTIFKLPALASIVKQHVKTDMTFWSYFQAARGLRAVWSGEGANHYAPRFIFNHQRGKLLAAKPGTKRSG